MTAGQGAGHNTVTAALDALVARMDHIDQTAGGKGTAAWLAEAVRALLNALSLRTYEVQPGTDDRGEQVVITVYGVDLSIRRRADGVFVHIDSTDLPDGISLVGEFDDSGENIYREGSDNADDGD